MGATLRPRDADIDPPGSTIQLFNWITLVRKKKMKYVCSRRRNIRVEALLSHALSQAQEELRIKQINRLCKWQHLKKMIAEKEGNNNTNTSSSSSSNNNNDENNNNNNDENSQDSKNIWSNELYPVLSSLDSFMSKLSEIKSPIQR